jgi:hypothetical protein
MKRLTLGVVLYLGFEATAGPLVIRYLTLPALHALAQSLAR